MANVIKHKRGSGSDPGASDLILGELAIRTDTGKLFTKMDSGAIAEIAGGGSDIAINTLSSSSGTGGGSATFNGSAYRFTLSQPPNVSAAQLLVSINGVIQKPVAGTGQPSEGFSVDGTDIILGDAPATGSDFFILTFKSLGVSEPADNSVTSAKIADGAVTNAKIASGIDGDKISNLTIDSTELADNCITSAKIVNGAIVNADINASAAIAGTKISPDFGSQNITTLGNIICGDGSTGVLNIKGNQAFLQFTDANDNDDFEIRVDGGIFRIQDQQNDLVSLQVNTDGHVDIPVNLDVGAGIDVTGAITGTGDLTIDTNTLHVDSTNNRVGIGTSSPATILHISQTNPELRIQGTNGSGGVHKIFSAGINSESLQLTGASNLLFNADTQFFRSSDEGTEYMRIDSSGRVGIGTSSPSTPLHVSTNTDGTSDLLTLHADADGTNFGIASIKFTGNTGNHAAFIKGGHTTNGDSILTFHTDAHDSGINPQERMRITSDGPHLLLGGTSDVNEITETSANAGMVIGGTGFGNAGLAIITSTSGTGRLYFGDAVANAAGRNRGQINYGHSDDHMRFVTAGTERMRIDSSGRLIVGATSGAGKFIVQDSSLPKIQANFNGTAHLESGVGGSGGGFAITTGHFLTFNHQPYANRGTDTNLTERMRITSNGFSKHTSDSGNYVSSTGNYHEFRSNSGNNPNTIFFHNGVGNTQFGIKIQTANEQNDTSHHFIDCREGGSATRRFIVYANGNVQNSNNSYGQLSDIKLKENVVDSNSQWNDIKQLKVRNFNFKNDNTNLKQIGLIAQEAEIVCPSLVFESQDQEEDAETGEIKDKGTTTKSVKYSVLYMKAIKCLQEAMARIEALETKVAALEAK